MTDSRTGTRNGKTLESAMNKALLTLAAVVAISTSAQANECLDKISEYAQQDHMVKAWGVERDTQNTVVFIDNVRNLKTIDIAFYGWTDKQAKVMENMFGCKNVKFENAYTDMGIPRF